MAMKKHTSTSSDDEDDTFYYHRTTPSTTTPTSSRPSISSGCLAPSKSTVYISKFDYSLTNSDLFTIFSTFGKVHLRKSRQSDHPQDRQTCVSWGVAFVLFVPRDDAVNAIKGMNGKVLNKRTLSVSIAADNGKAKEFIRKRVYKDKSRSYECGGEGHLSYECYRNALGKWERPEPKKARRFECWGRGRGPSRRK